MKKKIVTNENIENSRKMSTQKLGAFIADLRVKKNLTQLQLGDAVGVNKGTVSRWENGSYAPDIFRLMKLASVLDVTVNDLLCGEILEEDSTIDNDEATLNGIQMYANSVKSKCIKFFGIALLFLIFLFIFIFVVKEHSKWNVFSLKSSSDVISCSGQVVYNNKKSIFSLKNINYIADDFGSDDEPKANKVSIYVYSGEKKIFERSYNSLEKKYIHEYVDYINFTFEKNYKVELDDIYFLFRYDSYEDENNGEYIVDLKTVLA